MTQPESAIIYTQAMIDNALPLKTPHKGYTSLAKTVIRLEPEPLADLGRKPYHNGTSIVISKLLLPQEMQDSITSDNVDLVKVQLLGYTRMLYNNLNETQTILEFPKSVMSVLSTSEDDDYEKQKFFIASLLKASNAIVLENGQSVRGIYRDSSGNDTNSSEIQLREKGKASVTDINDGILYQIPKEHASDIQYQDDEGQTQTERVWGMLEITDSGLNTLLFGQVTSSIEFSVEFLQEDTPQNPPAGESSQDGV